MLVWLLVLVVASACLSLLLRGQVERYGRLCARLADHRKRMHADLVARIVKESEGVVHCIHDSLEKDASPAGQKCWEQALAEGGRHVAPDTTQGSPTASPPSGSAMPQRGGVPSPGRRQGPGPASVE